MWVRCMISTISRSMFAGKHPAFSIFHRAVLGCAFQVKQFALGFAPFVQGSFGHFQGDFVNIPILHFTIHFNGGGTPKWGQWQQFLGP
jgi:hypothetical protein